MTAQEKVGTLGAAPPHADTAPAADSAANDEGHSLMPRKGERHTPDAIARITAALSLPRYSNRFGHSKNDPPRERSHPRGRPRALSIQELQESVWTHFKGQLERSLWSKVDRRTPNECWPWIATTGRYGYGFVRLWVLPGHPEIRATRLIWVLTHGSIPADRLVCHQCDHPSCCNPAHLFLGTHQDNVDDMIRKGRRAPSPRGEHNHYAKLTDAAVHEIRLARSNGIAVKTIAEHHGVKIGTVYNILSGRAWRHVA